MRDPRDPVGLAGSALADPFDATSGIARASCAGAEQARVVRALFVRCHAGDVRAREQLVEHFLPLAHRLARRYQRAGESIDDLQQVASIGLINAIDRFDPERETSFFSYAVPTIVGELKRHLRDRTWTIRVPRRLQELTLKVNRAVAQLSVQLRRQPSVAEIATAVGVSVEDVLEAVQADGAYRVLSLQAPHEGRRDDDAARTLGDSIAVDEDGFAHAEQRARVSRLLVPLSGRERDVLRLRFQNDMRQADIAAAIGVSRMQVSRIIRDALVRLRSATDAD